MAATSLILAAGDTILVYNNDFISYYLYLWTRTCLLLGMAHVINSHSNSAVATMSAHASHADLPEKIL